MVSIKDKKIARRTRHDRVRAIVSGTPERPRLAVFRSNRNVFAQIIDDVNGVTLVSASTYELAARKENIKNNVGANYANIENATTVGKTIAERALEKGIKAVVFDRGGFVYHGLVQAVAEAAREAGLEF